MKINDYKGIIAQTAIYPTQVSNFGLAYSWLGLIEELHESRQAFDNYLKDLTNPDLKNLLVKEIGDVCWYITNICVLQNLDIEKVFDLSRDLKKLMDTATPIELYSGNVKKFYRDGKVIKKKELEDSLSLVINGILKSVERYDISLDEVLTTNYNKLMKRRATNTIQGDGDNREEE